MTFTVFLRDYIFETCRKYICMIAIDYSEFFYMLQQHNDYSNNIKM